MLFLNTYSIRIDTVKVPANIFQVLFKLTSAHCGKFLMVSTWETFINSSALLAFTGADKEIWKEVSNRETS